MDLVKILGYILLILNFCIISYTYINSLILTLTHIFSLTYTFLLIIKYIFSFTLSHTHTSLSMILVKTLDHTHTYTHTFSSYKYTHISLSMHFVKILGYTFQILTFGVFLISILTILSLHSYIYSYTHTHFQSYKYTHIPLSMHLVKTLGYTFQTLIFRVFLMSIQTLLSLHSHIYSHTHTHTYFHSHKYINTPLSLDFMKTWGYILQVPYFLFISYIHTSTLILIHTFSFIPSHIYGKS